MAFKQFKPAAAAAVVTLVNYRLYRFSRPILLACLVLLATLVFLAGLAYYLFVSQCKERCLYTTLYMLPVQTTRQAQCNPSLFENWATSPAVESSWANFSKDSYLYAHMLDGLNKPQAAVDVWEPLVFVLGNATDEWRPLPFTAAVQLSNSSVYQEDRPAFDFTASCRPRRPGDNNRSCTFTVTGRLAISPIIIKAVDEFPSNRRKLGSGHHHVNLTAKWENVDMTTMTQCLNSTPADVGFFEYLTSMRRWGLSLPAVCMKTASDGYCLQLSSQAFEDFDNFKNKIIANPERYAHQEQLWQKFDRHFSRYHQIAVTGGELPAHFLAVNTMFAVWQVCQLMTGNLRGQLFSSMQTTGVSCCSTEPACVARNVGAVLGYTSLVEGAVTLLVLLGFLALSSRDRLRMGEFLDTVAQPEHDDEAVQKMQSAWQGRYGNNTKDTGQVADGGRSSLPTYLAERA